ncbi:MAG: 2-acyl-glycerophospho-ethanolamine acyltransferase [Promethearchaeota archaeon]|nr:MAG: 2-acyl-glycerophospho-ethanolamine acyltransferase [Candidatus Lokiarchaeota archaeon]
MTESQPQEKSDMFGKIGGRENFNKALYGLTKGIGGLFLETFTNLKIIGKENIPFHNKAILTTISDNIYRDMLAITQLTGRQIHFMLSPKIIRHKIAGPVLKTLGMFRGTESKDDQEPVDQVFKYLNEKNDLVALTPEAKMDEETQVKAMAAIIKFAVAGDAPIIPLKVYTEKTKLFKTIDIEGIVIKVGTPIKVERKLTRDKYRTQRYELAEGIIKIIQSLKNSNQ